METTPSKPPRQLLIALDAMEWDLVKQWAAENKLPVFRRLIQEGTRAELSTTASQLPDTVWASLCTGTNPAKFEKYFYVQYDPATMGLKHVADDAIRGTPFWDYLSRAGVRVGVADVPKFPLSRSINGFQITNWGAHATKTARASSPPSLLRDVEARFGLHPVGDCDVVDATPRSRSQLRRRLLAGIELHGQLFRWLMREQQWDVFIASFSAAHCAGHHFWHYTDSTHPLHPTEDPHGLADTLEQVYRAIDREICRLQDLAGPETRVMVFAGHGMGPVYHASWNLPEMLELWGYGRKPPARAQEVKQERKARVNPWRIVKMVVPGKAQYFIKSMLPKRMQDQFLFWWYAGGQKWQGCRAFAVPNNDSAGAIRISVRGRDRNGLVEPGEEYRSVGRDLAAALSELTDPATGRPVVKRVTITDEEFRGPFLYQLPDITVLWDQSFPWSSVYSPRFGTLRIRRQDGRTGTHTPHGFLLAAGPGIPANLELAGRSIYDIAPTVLQTAGVPIPAHLDGRPLPLHKVMTA